MAKVTRRAYTLKKKKQVLQELSEGKCSVLSTARKHRIPDKTIRKWSLNADSILNCTAPQSCCKVKVKKATWPLMEICLVQFIKDRNKHGIPIMCNDIKAEAKLIAGKMGLTDFKASNGWLSRFFSRTKYPRKNAVGRKPKSAEKAKVKVEYEREIPILVVKRRGKRRMVAKMSKRKESVVVKRGERNGSVVAKRGNRKESVAKRGKSKESVVVKRGTRKKRVVHVVKKENEDEIPASMENKNGNVTHTLIVKKDSRKQLPTLIVRKAPRKDSPVSLYQLINS